LTLRNCESKITQLFYRHPFINVRSNWDCF